MKIRKKFTPSILFIKSTGALNDIVDEELLIPDPDDEVAYAELLNDEDDEDTK